MKLLKLLTTGALALVTYKAWQRHRAGPAPTAEIDDRGSTPPHGDPLASPEPLDAAALPRAGAQSSRGFGAA